MKVELVRNNKKAKTSTFVIKGTTPGFVNLLRKSIIEEVPTLAMEFIEFRKNSSVLYDEMLAHRLGLVPLTTDLSSYQFKGDDELSALNSVKLTLNKKGPCIVYAKDIVSTDPKVVPVYPEMQLVKLLKGQEVDFEATAVLGQGKEHIKWAPGLAFYHYQQTVKKADGKLPAGTIQASKVVSDDTVTYSSELPEGVEATQSDQDFVFTIESFGQLEPTEIIEKAITLNKEKLDQFVKLL